MARVRHLRVPDGAICDRLGLLPMYAVNQISTDIPSQSMHGMALELAFSASDRLINMVVGRSDQCVDDFTRPVTWSLAAKDGGSAPARPPEAAVDLARWPGCKLAGRFARSSAKKHEGSMAHHRRIAGVRR